MSDSKRIERFVKTGSSEPFNVAGADNDTTSYTLQYWKGGEPAGGSGYGHGAGLNASEVRAYEELQGNPDLDSITITPTH
jgi:hypothetical protein